MEKIAASRKSLPRRVFGQTVKNASFSTPIRSFFFVVSGNPLLAGPSRIGFERSPFRFALLYDERDRIPRLRVFPIHFAEEETAKRKINR